jgi:hypothetical protein
MKHTLGPWKFETSKSGFHKITKLLNDDDALIVDLMIHEGKEDEALANARLIASAPELLEALEDITETFKSCLGGSDPLYYTDFKGEIERAVSVINKAKGI